MPVSDRLPRRPTTAVGHRVDDHARCRRPCGGGHGGIRRSCGWSSSSVSAPPPAKLRSALSAACQARSTRRPLVGGDDARLADRHHPRQAVERLLADALAALVHEQRVVGDRAEPRQAPAHAVALLVGDELEPGAEGQGAQVFVARPARRGLRGGSFGFGASVSSPRRARALSFIASSVREAGSSSSSAMPRGQAARDRRGFVDVVADLHQRAFDLLPASSGSTARRRLAGGGRRCGAWPRSAAATLPNPRRGAAGISVSTSAQAWLSSARTNFGRRWSRTAASMTLGGAALGQFELFLAARGFDVAALGDFGLARQLLQAALQLAVGGFEHGRVAVEVLDHVFDRAAAASASVAGRLRRRRASSRRIRRPR